MALRILFLEDVPSDAELVSRQLTQAGLDFVSQLVDSRDTFERALGEFAPDVILSDHGLPGLVAPDGNEALALAGRHAGPIDLLLTDVVMPDINGRELARRLALERPAVKTLFLSGYTDDAILHHGVLQDGVAFLQKPFSLVALARKIREVIDAPAA
jgi:CheY-like chemotaxis protein